MAKAVSDENLAEFKAYADEEYGRVVVLPPVSEDSDEATLARVWDILRNAPDNATLVVKDTHFRGAVVYARPWDGGFSIAYHTGAIYIAELNAYYDAGEDIWTTSGQTYILETR